MNRMGYTALVIGILAAGLALGIAVVRPLGAVRSELDALEGYFPAPQPVEEVLNGEYEGAVTLDGVYSGVFSDTVEAEAVDLGGIELALALGQSGAEIAGHVNLSSTQVYTQEHTVAGEAVGPLVSGTFDGTSLQLVSERFEWLVSPGRTLKDGRMLPERRATRQFQLVSSEVQSDGSVVQGVYRETIWGAAPAPVTVEGAFHLRRATPLLYKHVFLPVILRNH